jgi:hypothetical protein
MREMTGVTPRLVPSDGTYAMTNFRFNRAQCPQDDEACPLSTGQTVEAVAQQCVHRTSVVKVPPCTRTRHSKLWRDPLNRPPYSALELTGEVQRRAASRQLAGRRVTGEQFTCANLWGRLAWMKAGLLQGLAQSASLVALAT